MGSNGVWWFIAIAMIVIGLILILTGRDKEVDTGLEPQELEHKDGVPILPRSQRQLDDNGQPMPVVQSSQTASDVTHETTSSPVSSTAQTTSVTTHTSDVLSNLADVAASRTTQATPVQSTQSTQQSTATSEAEDFEVTLDDETIAPAPQPALPKVAPAKPTSASEQPVMPIIQKDFENVVSADFDEETPELDDYFQYKAEESLRNNDALLGHKKTVTIVVSPRDTFTGISGKTVMSLVRQYAMKYGVLNMFHRYENPEGTGMLWFSMLGVTIDGVESFDLVTLPEMNYRGLALFLSLPHPQAVRGFDSMIQVAKAIADELDADIHDEAGYLLDNAQLQALRAVVSEYKLGQ